MANSNEETMIQPATKRIKLDECENNDRLSDLPECVILHILSFLNTRDTVRTCVLSPRWKDLWKRTPALILHSSDFETLKIFTKFVSKVLSLHDSSITLHTLDFYRNRCVEPHLLKRIVNYAISHNVERLGLNIQCDIEQIPQRLFSCQTLTYLKLYVYPKVYVYNGLVDYKPSFPKSINLPALTTLHLGSLAFCGSDNNGRAEPFSGFNRLTTLVLHSCALRDAVALCISSATLVNFTMDEYSYEFYEIELCTPSLGSFTFVGALYQKVFGSGLSHVKHVDIDAEILSMETDPSFLLSLLLNLVNIKSLTVTSSTLQVLSLSPNLSETKLPSLGNLWLLKIRRKKLPYTFREKLIDAKLQKIKSRKEAAKLRKSFEEAGLESSAPIHEGAFGFLLQNWKPRVIQAVNW